MTPQERDRMNSLCIQVQEEKNYNRFQALQHERSGKRNFGARNATALVTGHGRVPGRW
jgi:hypothetical protein